MKWAVFAYLILKQILTIKGTSTSSQDPFYFVEKMFIKIEDEWITSIFYDAEGERIFGSMGNDLKVMKY